MTISIKRGKQRKGFAVMNRALALRISSMGGKAVAKKRGKKWMRKIGSKGGLGGTGAAKRRIRKAA